MLGENRFMCSSWFSEAQFGILLTCLGNVIGPFGLFSRKIRAVSLPVREINCPQKQQKTRSGASESAQIPPPKSM